MTAMDWPHTNAPLAVLCSGGLDSAILLGEAIRSGPSVTPIYIRVGALWEEVEQNYLKRFLRAVASPRLKPLVTFDQPVNDLYAKHWSMTGDGVPGYDTPDDDAYLPGRNLLLFTKPLLWCLANDVPVLATAPLAGNPFPDATAEFYDSLARLAGLAVDGEVKILRPYSKLNKKDVLLRGRGMPLEHTFSCLQPLQQLHCGACNKCGERRRGFVAAGLHDPTRYAS